MSAREGDVAVDGRELDTLSDDELTGRLAQTSVFARVHPTQKLRIVEAFQARGDVVAMTGDGVNDAPALARADVGVAMGATGTEVAKGASKVVITDDNFATIVDAVAEGRHVHRNLKRLILYLGSCSIAEVLALISALVIGLPVPLAAVQILWVNLVTSGLVTVPLIMGPPEGDEMQLAPVPRDEPLLSSDVLRRMVLIVPAIAVSTLGYFAYRLSLGVPLAQARTEAFTVLVVSQWFNVLNCRSGKASGLSLDLLKNRWLTGGLILGNALQAAVIFAPPLNRVFHTVPLPLQEVVAIAVVGSLVLWVEEIRKALARRSERRAGLDRVLPSLGRVLARVDRGARGKDRVRGSSDAMNPAGAAIECGASASVRRVVAPELCAPPPIHLRSCPTLPTAGLADALRCSERSADSPPWTSTSASQRGGPAAGAGPVSARRSASRSSVATRRSRRWRSGSRRPTAGSPGRVR